MAVIRIKNINTELHRRLRFIGSEGSSIVASEQDGALVQFGAKDLRVCLSPNITDSPNSATIDTSVIEMLGKFNIDVDSELFENRSDVFNFNNANDTKIGSSFASNSSSHGFKGTLYSVKMFRGTSDLSLLDQTVLEPESPADVILDGIPPLEPGVLQFW